MFSKQDQIQGYDDALMAAINAEEQRQEDHIELIASENYTSKRVMQAQGSGLTNKYAEGYPWPSSVPSNCSAPTTPTSSLTPAPRPTARCTWHCCRPATPSWA